MKKRRISVSFGDLTVFPSHSSEFLNSWLNTYSMLIPDGELFVIRTVNKFRKKYSRKLIRDIDLLIYQEGQHSSQHKKHLESLGDVPAIRRFNHGIRLVNYKILERIFPNILALSAASGIEHINAFIADHHIRHRILDHAHPRVQELFFWHFAEEIEHKSVAFDALSEMTSSRFIRFVGLLLGGCNFVFLLLTGTVWIQFHTSRNWKRFLIEGYQFFFRSIWIFIFIDSGLNYIHEKKFSP